jgi:hypothetical protein
MAVPFAAPHRRSGVAALWPRSQVWGAAAAGPPRAPPALVTHVLYFYSARLTYSYWNATAGFLNSEERPSDVKEH